MSAGQWQAIDALIAERDPYCRGVVVLGQSATIDELRSGFRAARESTTCRGFAVGRTIFEEPSRRWLAGAIDDDTLIREVRAKFEMLIDAWRAVRRNRATANTDREQATRLPPRRRSVRYLPRHSTHHGTADGKAGAPLFGGVFAIFGHGNVAGIGEALFRHRETLPTYRAHNEQAMAHAAIAYAKAHMRRRMMACTTSIGPGATNLLTAAALAHVNRLAGAVSSRRRVHVAGAGPGVAAGRGFPRRRRVRQRLLQTGITLFRSYCVPCAVVDRIAARNSGADRSRAMRSGHARSAAGCADHGVRFPGGFLLAIGWSCSARRRRWQLSSRVRSRCCANRSGR